MMRRQFTPLLLGLLAAAGCRERPEAVGGEAREEASAEPSHLSEVAGEARITLDSATVARIGLVTERLTAVTRRDEVELPALIVADPEATSFVRAGISGLLAVHPGSAWPRFGQRVGAGEVLGQVGDARPITAPRGGTVSRVLTQPGELVQAGQELLELTDYRAPLAQVTWPADGPAPPGDITLAERAGDRRVRGILVGPAPQADPLTRAPAWLYRVTAGWPGLRPGAAVSAFLPTSRGAHRGVLIPRRATLQWDALVWAYVERAPGSYARVRVPTDEPTAGGWLVARGFAPGDRIVTTGAGQLLSEEFRARIVVGEEVGE
jgi:biotin carboxyl carrier protein